MKDLLEVRFHGRGGQGVVTASRLLAEAALFEGKFVQGFPLFGPEREGAPVKAFTRISSSPIRVRTQIYTPDVVVVLDPTLVKVEKVTDGLKDGGWLIVNTAKSPMDVKSEVGVRVKVATVNATKIALEVFGAPRVNAPILGSLVRAVQLVSLDSLLKATRSSFSGRVAESNVRAIERAYNETMLEED
ncbi:MAG: 2-oxoacid:acceptor oxidoreductase family protein [Candidatus Jordarchaeales archaeon]